MSIAIRAAHAVAGLAVVIATPAQAESSGKPAVEEVVVTGYRPGDASHASKVNVSDLENAQAISVVTAGVIKDQGITRLADALRNVAGVSRSSTYGFFDAFQIRGYDAAYGSVFLDGLKNGNVAGESHELGGLEQIEVIKGPASGLFGAAPLGGVVNLVSKRPRAATFVDTSVTTGSYDLFAATVDANSMLNKDSTLLGRMNVIYKDADDFVDFSHAERMYVAPALTWEIGAATTLTLLSRYQRDLTSPWSPLPASGTILPNPNGRLPVTYSVNDDDQRAFYNQRSTQAGYDFQHRFSDSIALSQNLRYERSTDDWNRWMFASGINEEQTAIGRYFYGPFHQATRDLGVDTRLNAQLTTGAVEHQVLLGVDYGQSKNRSRSAGLYDGPLNPLGLFHPDYSVPLTPADTGADAGGESQQTGFYVHDHLVLSRKLSVTFGGRWDETKTDDQADHAFSPTVGATWSLTPAASLYANVAKSFTPTPSWQTRADGSLLPPETGRNVEAGLKVAAPSGSFAGMVSLFQLTRENVATADPDNLFFYIVTGEQRSRGFEAEGAWRPTRALDVRVAYSYIDAKITKDNSYPVGTRLPNVPRNNLSLWSKYTVQAGPLANLGVSLGLLYNSDKTFYEGAPYTLPGYTLIDAGLSYRFGDWTAQLDGNNLLDKRHFTDACCLDRITPGEPRNWQLSLSKSL